MKTKHIWKILLGCLFSALLIYFTLKQIDFKTSMEYAKSANYTVLIVAALIYVLTYVARSVRFCFLIMPIKKTPLFKNFPYTVLGFFMNNLIPLRIGEFIRAKVTGERLGISRSASLAAIVVERLLDITIFILFFFAVMYFLPFPDFIAKSFYLCAFIFGGLFIVLWGLAMRKEKTINLICKIPMPAKIKNLLLQTADKFISGLDVLKSKKIFVCSFAFSIAVWIIESSSLMIAASACGFNISLAGAAFTVIIIGIGAIIPTAPGFVGAFEFMGVAALSALGIDKDQAFSCIIVYHFIQLTVIATLGLSSIFLTRISFKDLFKFE
ncbi:MAG: flippase-like domain-containing protein [Elusimicrobiota bacterium]|jgi:uncharacterized protein (TIRG00374 family)|nr:flippase-like domain-containing protein [Elusimicrobiota bacterium]